MDELESNKLFFKKYLLMNKIAQGSFGAVYYGMNTHTKEKVAIKLEERNKQKTFLEREAFILYNLKGPGIPEIKTFGRNKKYNILVQTLLGKSLYDIFDSNNKKFNVKDICNIGIQILERFEYVHSKNYIHRDIKPQNFLIGRENNDENIIYLIDFGLAKKYRSERGNHVKFSITSKVTGTPRFSSLNAMRGVEQSRRDDLESLCYIIIYFFNGFLPWQGLQYCSILERFNAILDMKKNIKVSSLCEGLPTEISELFRYVKKLGFTEEPNYNYMKQLFLSILKKNRLNNDNNFSWIKVKNNNYNNFKKNYSHISKKNWNCSRLFRQIKNSLDKKEKNKKVVVSNNNLLKNNKEEKGNHSLNKINLNNNNIQKYIKDKKAGVNNSVKIINKKKPYKSTMNLDNNNQTRKNILNKLVTTKNNNSLKFTKRRNRNKYQENFDINDKINNFIYQSENFDNNFSNISNFNSNKNIDNLLYNSQNNQVINHNKSNNIIKYKKDEINQNKNNKIINNRDHYIKYKAYVPKHFNYLTNPNLEKQINKNIKKHRIFDEFQISMPNVEKEKMSHRDFANAGSIPTKIMDKFYTAKQPQSLSGHLSGLVSYNTLPTNVASISKAPDTHNIYNILFSLLEKTINNNNSINYKKITKKPIKFRNILNTNIINNFDYLNKNSVKDNENNRDNIIINNLYINSYYNNFINKSISSKINNVKRIQEKIPPINKYNRNFHNNNSKYKTLAVRETLKLVQ